MVPQSFCVFIFFTVSLDFFCWLPLPGCTQQQQRTASTTPPQHIHPLLTSSVSPRSSAAADSRRHATRSSTHPWHPCRPRPLSSRSCCRCCHAGSRCRRHLLLLLLLLSALPPLQLGLHACTKCNERRKAGDSQLLCRDSLQETHLLLGTRCTAVYTAAPLRWHTCLHPPAVPAARLQFHHPLPLHHNSPSGTVPQ